MEGLVPFSRADLYRTYGGGLLLCWRLREDYVRVFVVIPEVRGCRYLSFR